MDDHAGRRQHFHLPGPLDYHRDPWSRRVCFDQRHLRGRLASFQRMVIGLIGFTVRHDELTEQLCSEEFLPSEASSGEVVRDLIEPVGISDENNQARKF